MPTHTEVIVVRCDGHQLPHEMANLAIHDGVKPETLDTAISTARRLVVLGSDADLAAVLTRLMRRERLDIEVAHIRRHSRWRNIGSRALTATAQRVPLIRDDSGTVMVGTALWLPPAGKRMLHGEAVVDDDVLFDGAVAAVRIEPTSALPGLRATSIAGRWARQRWLTGRAVQLGTTGAVVVRDGVPAPREVKRSTWYRHTTGWLRVPC